MLSASQPPPSHLPARSRASLHHPAGPVAGKRAAYVALSPGFAHQLWHFYVSHPKAAASSMSWHPWSSSVPSAHLGPSRALQTPSMLQAAEPSSGSPAPLLHGTCGKLSWQTHRILLSLALGRAVGCCTIPEATAHSAGTSTTALTPHPHQVPPHECHSPCPQGWWHRAAEEQVLGTGAMQSPCAQTPAGKGIKQSPRHHPPTFPKSSTAPLQPLGTNHQAITACSLSSVGFGS